MKDICDGRNEFIQTLKMDNSIYNVPKFNWSRTKFSENRQKKLDYISLFPEKVYPRPEELCKIYAKKKLTVPGPEVYDMTKNWSKKSPHDYENQKGKTYRSDRITNTANIIKKAKRDKYPGPNFYKPKT